MAYVYFKLQAKDYELTLLPPPHKLKSDPFPKQSQDQSLFQAEHFRPKSCFEFIIGFNIWFNIGV